MRAGPLWRLIESRCRTASGVSGAGIDIFSIPAGSLDSPYRNEESTSTKQTLTPTVLLYATVDTFNLDRGAVALALSFCEAAGSNLTGYLHNLDANVPPNKDGRSYQQMSAEFDLREASNKANANQLVDSARQRGIDAQAVTTINHAHGIAGCVVDQARLHDVLVIGCDSSGMLSDRLLAENFLFEIGRPMLVAPTDFAGEFTCKRIVVAWDNSRVAARALGDALMLIPGIEEVILLTIGDEKNVRSSLDQSATERVLMRRGLVVQSVTKHLDGRTIGEAIQDSAHELKADLLVMGGYGHSRLRDFILGGATLSVLVD